MTRPVRSSVMLVVFLLGGSVAGAGCTQVTDLWSYEVIDAPRSDVGHEVGAWSDAGDDAASLDLVLEQCDPDPCEELGRVCVGGFCGECLPGYLEAASGLCVLSTDPCNPDPCELTHRSCTDGVCGDCTPGFVEDDQGICVSTGEPCLPDPCESVNKTCVEGFCDKCLPGFFETPEGQCVAPIACFPNPCTEPLRTQCAEGPEGEALCYCDPATHLNDAGECTFSPCDPSPCTEPMTVCSFDSMTAVCACPSGFMDVEGACLDDPCEPNPCGAYAQSVCELFEGAAQCQCDLGFVQGDAGCEEAAVVNASTLPSADGVATVGHQWQLFADDVGVDEREGFTRRVHALAMHDVSWAVGPDLASAFIGQSRASGSLVYVPVEVRGELPDGHALKPYPWRLYYMGYRQPFTLDAQPAWMCIAAASSPKGPWLKPLLDGTSPQPNCSFRVDGLVQTEVSLRDGSWTLSATRLGLGDAQGEPGLHVYTSNAGVFWEPLSAGAVVASALAPTDGTSYARVGTQSRLVWDASGKSFLGLVSLVSPAFGNARGVMNGGEDPLAEWVKAPDALACPGILGPSSDDLSEGSFLGDMVAWREGASFLALVQKHRTDCTSDEVLLATSRDGRHWLPVVDEASGLWKPVVHHGTLSNVARVNSLSGGPPGLQAKNWHFLMGASELGVCEGVDSPGGVIRGEIAQHGLVGLVADPGALRTLLTRPMTLKAPLVGQRFYLSASVTDKLVIQIEKLSPVGTILAAAEGMVVAGEYVAEEVSLSALTEATDGVFRVRFTFTAGGEIFAFKLDDPVCSPNPCVDLEGKSGCADVGGAAFCLCDPPLHDDGTGECTSDPCLPNPCTLPHQAGCDVVSDAAVCGCEEGWVASKGVCVSDPCTPVAGASPCEPYSCKVNEGEIACYCPAGSVEQPTGCLEVDPRAFVLETLLDGSDVQGLAGADSRCAVEAAASGLPGAFGAWLSGEGVQASDRFEGGGPWRTYDPDHGLWVRLVASDVADLRDGELDAPLNYRATGELASEGCAAWTATTPKGVASPPVGGLGGSCVDWTSAEQGQKALAGSCHAAGAAWTAAGPRFCSEKLAIYCFELPAASGEDGAVDPAP